MNTEIDTVNAGTELANSYSSLNPKTAQEAAKLYAATSNAKALKDAVNVPLEVTDVVIRPGQFADDSGEVVDRLVTTLITADGEAYASNSPTVADGIRGLMTIMGEPGTKFWGKSLTVVPKLQSSNNNRSFITLTLPQGK